MEGRLLLDLGGAPILRRLRRALGLPDPVSGSPAMAPLRRRATKRARTGEGWGRGRWDRRRAGHPDTRAQQAGGDDGRPRRRCDGYRRLVTVSFDI